MRVLTGKSTPRGSESSIHGGAMEDSQSRWKLAGSTGHCELAGKEGDRVKGRGRERERE